MNIVKGKFIAGPRHERRIPGHFPHVPLSAGLRVIAGCKVIRSSLLSAWEFLLNWV